jgi:hypothetical protein
LEDVPDGEDVFVEVIVRVEVVVAVRVRVSREEMVERGVPVGVFDPAEVFVVRGVTTEVRLRISDWVCGLDGKEVLVDVVVFVDVFD